ncbi:MAG: helix-turn-helix domain-containing protein [Thermoleophilia bacterium]
MRERGKVPVDVEPEGPGSAAEPDPEVVALGAAIRALRTEAGLTLEQLAARVGVSRSMVSAIELGRASPSVTTLRGLAGALGVPIASLFTALGGEGTADLDRSGRRLVVRRGGRKRLLARRSNVYYELLTPDVNRQVEFLWGEFEPGSGAPPDPGAFAAHAGEENVVCIEGTVVFHVDGREYVLDEGDSISFDCSVPHRLDNRSDRRAVAVIAITPPTW